MNNEHELPEREFWAELASLGAAISHIHQHGGIHGDLNSTNVLITKDGNITLIDPFSVEEKSYPDDKNAFCLDIMSFLSDNPTYVNAPFRFGYIHQGGPAALEFFNKIRSQYGINAYTGIEGVKYTSSNMITPSAEIKKFDNNDDWKKWRENKGIKLDEVNCQDYYQWRENNENAENFLLKHSAQAHLVATCRKDSILGIIEAVFGLQRYHQLNENWIDAVGCGMYCSRWIETLSVLDRDQEIKNQLSGFRSQIRKATNLSYQQGKEKVRQDLRRLPMVSNPFYWIWCIEDYKSGSISFENPEK
jgi:hypothetical protein